LLENLIYVSDIVAPNDAFALHFRRQLGQRLNLPTDSDVERRLQTILGRDGYWMDRFNEFGLRTSH